jgi:hypothetical protein
MLYPDLSLVLIFRALALSPRTERALIGRQDVTMPKSCLNPGQAWAGVQAWALAQSKPHSLLHGSPRAPSLSLQHGSRKGSPVPSEHP